MHQFFRSRSMEESARDVLNKNLRAAGPDVSDCEQST